MPLILAGTSTRKKEYQDSANWSKTLTATAQVQPVNRKVNGTAVVQHVLVREFKARDTVCVAAGKCSTTQMDSPVTVSVRISGPVGDVSIKSLWAEMEKLVKTSGDLSTPVLTDANFS